MIFANPHILSINAGSSSIKFASFEAGAVANAMKRPIAKFSAPLA